MQKLQKMNNIFIRNIIRFLGLILLQVMLFNNMNLGSYLNPSVYILFILLLPIKINRSLLLILAFATGYIMDYLGNTPGLHSAACVFMAFLRPGMINLLFRNTEFDKNEEPTPFSIGWGGFLRYSIILIPAHQILLFFMEVLSFKHFFFTLSKSLLSSLLSLFLILVLMLIFSKRRKRI